jgi:integrase
MRPAEECAMTTGSIDRSGNPWVYRPADHKTRHHGHDRAIMLGPKAQEILTPLLKLNPTAPLFSPADAVNELLERRHQARETPLDRGNAPGSYRNRRPGRAPGDRYDVAAYRRAIARACEVAFEMPVELDEPRSKQAIASDTPEQKKLRREQRAAWHAEHVWHPHQLRHTAATLLRKEFGLEAARVILGHKTLAVTAIYAEKNVEAAKRIMAPVD